MSRYSNPHTNQTPEIIRADWWNAGPEDRPEAPQPEVPGQDQTPKNIPEKANDNERF